MGWRHLVLRDTQSCTGIKARTCAMTLSGLSSYRALHTPNAADKPVTLLYLAPLGVWVVFPPDTLLYPVCRGDAWFILEVKCIVELFIILPLHVCGHTLLRDAASSNISYCIFTRVKSVASPHAVGGCHSTHTSNPHFFRTGMSLVAVANLSLPFSSTCFIPRSMNKLPKLQPAVYSSRRGLRRTQVPR